MHHHTPLGLLYLARWDLTSAPSCVRLQLKSSCILMSSWRHSGITISFATTTAMLLLSALHDHASLWLSHPHIKRTGPIDVKELESGGGRGTFLRTAHGDMGEISGAIQSILSIFSRLMT